MNQSHVLKLTAPFERIKHHNIYPDIDERTLELPMTNIKITHF